MLFQPHRVHQILEELAHKYQIYIGTTSWRFPGWCGTLYDEENYLWRDRFSERRFNDHCLEEYARVFHTVEVDSTYYALPKTQTIKRLAAQVPESFRFSFKVPDAITIKTYPNLAKFGRQAGKPNDYFLDHHLFQMAFLRQMEAIQDQVGVLIFEFSHFHQTDFERGRQFVESLDQFFSKVPNEFNYGVEIRNSNLLHADYFSMLQSHGVSHVYNQWTHMPSVVDQIETYPLNLNQGIAARFLLTPGRSFESARSEFEPFHRIYEIDSAARHAFVSMVQRVIKMGVAKPDSPHHYLYLSNDLEGNALHTLADLAERIEEAMLL